MENFFIGASKVILVWAVGMAILLLFMGLIHLVTYYGIGNIAFLFSAILVLVIGPFFIGLVLVGEKVFPFLKDNKND